MSFFHGTIAVEDHLHKNVSIDSSFLRLTGINGSWGVFWLEIVLWWRMLRQKRLLTVALNDRITFLPAKLDLYQPGNLRPGVLPLRNSFRSGLIPTDEANR